MTHIEFNSAFCLHITIKNNCINSLWKNIIIIFNICTGKCAVCLAGLKMLMLILLRFSSFLLIVVGPVVGILLIG